MTDRQPPGAAVQGSQLWIVLAALVCPLSTSRAPADVGTVVGTCLLLSPARIAVTLVTECYFLRSEIWLGIIKVYDTSQRLDPIPNTCCMHVAEVCWVGLWPPLPHLVLPHWRSRCLWAWVGTVVDLGPAQLHLTEALVSATGGGTEVVLVSESAWAGLGWLVARHRVG